VATVLSVENLSFGYGPVEVLTHVTFAVEGGDYVILAGPNGAGKTTLIRLVLGIAGTYQGKVELFGQSLSGFAGWGRVGYLPQRVNAFNPLFPATVREVVGLGLLSQKTFPRRITHGDEVRVRQTLELMGIPDLKDMPVGELSGGQQQRVFLARALVSHPELLILDEPSTALDPQARESFLESIRRLNREQGITIILITHDTDLIGKYATRVLYLDRRVVYFGPSADLCNSPEMSRYSGVCPAERTN
jgi:zinc transport system ATP-binding protein